VDQLELTLFEMIVLRGGDHTLFSQNGFTAVRFVK
jgi:hypothetical protein